MNEISSRYLTTQGAEGIQGEGARLWDDEGHTGRVREGYASRKLDNRAHSAVNRKLISGMLKHRNGMPRSPPQRLARCA